MLGMRKFSKNLALILSFVMVSLLCVLPVSANDSVNVRFNDDYNSYTVGQYTQPAAIPNSNGIYASTGAACEVIANPYDPNLGNSLYIKGTNYTQWNPTAAATINLTADKFVIRFQFGLVDSTQAFIMELAPHVTGTDSGVAGGRAQIMRANASSDGKIRTGGPRTAAADIVPGRMYDIQYVFEKQPGDSLLSYSMYVDGEKKVSGINLYPGLYGPEQQEPINFDGICHLGFSSSGAIIDNFRVYAATASGIETSEPANGAKNVDVYSSVEVSFDTDVKPETVNTTNVVVSGGAAISEIVKISARQYRIVFSDALASNTEYAVSFSDIEDILGNYIYSQVRFTTVDASFVPTKTVGFIDDFSDYEPGAYDGAVQLGNKYSPNGAAKVEVAANPYDKSLGNSLHAISGNVQTQWTPTSSSYIGLGGDKIVLDFKAAFVSNSSAIGIFVEGGQDIDNTATGKSQIMRTETGKTIKTGYKRANLLSPFETGKMYNFTYVFTTGEANVAKYDVYVDGTYTASGCFASTYYGAGYEIPMYTFNHLCIEATDLYLDDITVYTADGIAVEKTDPQDGESAARAKNFITVKTTTPIDYTSTAGVTVVGAPGEVTAVERIDSNTAKISFSAPFDYETSYSLRIKGIKDILGNSMISTIISFTTSEYIPYTIGDIAFYQNSADITKTGFEAGTITAKASVGNEDYTKELPCAVIIAIYKGDRLVKTAWTAVDLNAGETRDIEASINLEIAEGGKASDYSVKAFVWEDVSETNIAPLTPDAALAAKAA